MVYKPTENWGPPSCTGFSTNGVDPLTHFIIFFAILWNWGVAQFAAKTNLQLVNNW